MKKKQMQMENLKYKKFKLNFSKKMKNKKIVAVLIVFHPKMKKKNSKSNSSLDLEKNIIIDEDDNK